MKAIVVGAGGAARDLLRRLSDRWEVTLVDTDPSLLERAGAVREIEAIEGDGSSRITLGRAAIQEADAVVAAAGDDDVNLEICRLAQAAGLMRVVAVAADPERVGDYRDIEVPAFAPDSLTARQLEIHLEPRRIASTAFADGRAEAIEFRIAPDSPVRGMALQEIRSESWLVAAVLRDGTLIVPHGDTVLRTDDLVTVVGAAADFSHIVRTFTAGEARFPLDFGKGVLVALDRKSDLEGSVSEAIALTRGSPATSVIVAHADASALRDEAQAAEVEMFVEQIRGATNGVDLRLRAVTGSPSRRLHSLVGEESVGAIVMAAPPRGRFVRIGAVRALRGAAALGRPVLFSRGSHPYRRIVAPARDTRSGVNASRAAIDLAGTNSGTVTAVAVVSPRFLSGSDGRRPATEALTRMREEAAVLEVPVHRLLREGNPVRVIEEAALDADLVVLGASERRASIFTPGIVGHLLERLRCSVLVVPGLTE